MFVNALYIENCTMKVDNLFKDLENNVFDEYNKGKISKNEMINIITWCERIKESQKEELRKEYEK